jgi:hypothetical protein
MTRAELRRDFEQAFKEPEWELRRTRDGNEYASYRTQAAWLAWVSSYETYVGPLTVRGE